MRALNIDNILKIVGEFHCYQWILDTIFVIMVIPRTYMILIMYFAALKPDWKCVKNSTLCPYNATRLSSDNSRCSMLRSEWEYTEKKDFSIVTEFDIYCDREWLIQLTTSITFLGWGLGAIILGWVADSYGRKSVLFPSMIGCLSVGFVAAFMPNIELFIVCRFIIGFFLPGTSLQMFIIISEFVGEKRRPLAGIILFVAFVTSLCLQALQAYFIRSWKLLFIVCTAPYAFIPLFWKFVPESIRWLRLKGKSDEAMELLHRIGQRNNRPLPDDVCLEPIDQQDSTHKVSPLDLFRGVNIAIKSIIQGYNWLIFGMVYYGLSLASSDLGGSLYRNYVLLSIVEFPAALLSIVGCDYFGRKKTVMHCCLIGSITCIIIGVIPRTENGIIARIAIAMVSKLFISASFDGVYTWAVEIYPTSIRSEGMGFLQITSRIGAASAPWVAKSLLKLHSNLPFYVMGGLALLSSLVMILLPETKGMDTLETSKDVKKFTVKNDVRKESAMELTMKSKDLESL